MPKPVLVRCPCAPINGESPVTWNDLFPQKSPCICGKHLTKKEKFRRSLRKHVEKARIVNRAPISVYTDGSASVKAGNGGWAFVALKGGEYAEGYGYADKGKTGEMELMAVAQALKWLPLGTAPIRIFSDSQYVVNTLNVWAQRWEARGWMSANGRLPSHFELIKSMMERIAEHRKQRSVSIVWIPGHTNHKHNERADVLAGKARKERLSNL